MQWLTGNIGFHHLAPRIPNDRLAACVAVDAALRTLTLRSSLAWASLKLWDEERGRLARWPPSPPRAPAA